MRPTPEYKVGDKVKVYYRSREGYDIGEITKVEFYTDYVNWYDEKYTGFMYNGVITEHVETISLKHSVSSNIFSNWTSQYLKPLEENKKCICGIVDLISRGCTCGGI